MSDSPPSPPSTSFVLVFFSPLSSCLISALQPVLNYMIHSYLFLALASRLPWPFFLFFTRFALNVLGNGLSFSIILSHQPSLMTSPSLFDTVLQPYFGPKLGRSNVTSFCKTYVNRQNYCWFVVIVPFTVDKVIIKLSCLALYALVRNASIIG